MADTYQSFLALLGSLQESLQQLTALTRQKAEAAARDDLTALDEIMKQEQALGLAFRGMEQTREKLLRQLGCGAVPLSRLPEHFPPANQEEARQAVAALLDQYQDYRRHAGATRSLLEGRLREIEGIISGMGGAPEPQGGAGYTPPPPPDTPPTMKTDFRA